MMPSANSAAASQPFPPLPDLSAGPKGGGGASSQAAPPSFLASIMSGIAPVKSGVDAINAACRDIVKSGAVPGGEQVCAQIKALANQLLPAAAQNAMQSSGGQAPTPMPPPPNGPAPIGAAGGPPTGPPGQAG